jgi:hypothetical protein
MATSYTPQNLRIIIYIIVRFVSLPTVNKEKQAIDNKV